MADEPGADCGELFSNIAANPRRVIFAILSYNSNKTTIVVLLLCHSNEIATAHLCTSNLIVLLSATQSEKY